MMDWFIRLYTDPTAERLLVAFILGTIVGAERQFRHEYGGVRVNVLVSLGAAAFVDLMLTIGQGANLASGLGAIVTGVGFLGAGLIMREGFNVRGLSTAATVWCSAAMGANAGASEYTAATLICLFVTGVNVFLRPVVSFVENRRKPPGDTDASI